MAKKGMRIGGGYYVNYGNAADYLARRVARDRPDILHEMKDGKYNSVRQAAIAAGIIKIPTRYKRHCSTIRCELSDDLSMAQRTEPPRHREEAGPREDGATDRRTTAAIARRGGRQTC